MSLNQVAFFVLCVFLWDDNLVDEKDLAVVVVAAVAAKQALSADVSPVASVLLILEEVDAMVVVAVAVAVVAVAADHIHYT